MLEARKQEIRDHLWQLSHEELIQYAFDVSVENEQLKSAQKETAGANTEMTKQFLAAKQEIASLKNQVAFLSRENVRLTDIINQHANALYGRKSEKVEDIFCVDTGQEEICDPLDEDAEEPEEELTSSDLYKTRKQLLRSGERCHGKKTPGKRENDLSKLPVKITYDCDVDGINEQYGEGTWGILFWERHDRIEIIPCTTFRHSIYTPVIKHIEEGYLQRMPNHYEFRPRSLVSSSLLSLIIKDKYSLFLPTYRQEHDEGRFGIQISRQTMTNWILWTSELVWPVYVYLCRLFIMSIKYQECDETTYTVIRDGRKPGSKSYIWCHSTGELSDETRIVIYCYEPTRGTDHLREFYQDVEEPFHLGADAYISYRVFAEENEDIVTLSGCFMHARRPWFRAYSALAKATGLDLTAEENADLPEVKAITLLSDMFDADNQLKGLDPDERHKMRQTEVKTATKKYFDFIHSIDINDPGLRDKTKEAIEYSINHEEELCAFLEDGRIALDTGEVERNIKPIAQGRKNYLFSTSVRGAIATAVMSTFIRTAHENGADIYYYLKYILENMAKYPQDVSPDNLAKMMPWTEEYRKYERKEKEILLDELLASNEKPDIKAYRQTG